jgi:hypothetical protein
MLAIVHRSIILGVCCLVCGPLLLTYIFGLHRTDHKDKDPSLLPEKLTNRVVDIDGTATGTGGQREMAMAPMYRQQRQEVARADAAYAREAIRAARQTFQSAKDRAADVSAVAALR